MRKAVLGERHVDTIASMHNLAELFLAMGKEDLAADIQNQILELLDPAKVCAAFQGSRMLGTRNMSLKSSCNPASLQEPPGICF